MHANKLINYVIPKKNFRCELEISFLRDFKGFQQGNLNYIYRIH